MLNQNEGDKYCGVRYADYSFRIKRIASNGVVLIEDNVKLFGVAQLAEFIVLVQIGPRFRTVFQPFPIRLAEVGENLSLGGDVVYYIFHRGCGKIPPIVDTSP